MVAAGEELESVHHVSMRHIYVEPLLGYEHLTVTLGQARTLGYHVSLAALVNHTRADYTNKISALKYLLNTSIQNLIGSFKYPFIKFKY
jgi:hypothetical protein